MVSKVSQVNRVEYPYLLIWYPRYPKSIEWSIPSIIPQVQFQRLFSGKVFGAKDINLHIVGRKEKFCALLAILFIAVQCTHYRAVYALPCSVRITVQCTHYRAVYALPCSVCITVQCTHYHTNCRVFNKNTYNIVRIFTFKSVYQYHIRKLKEIKLPKIIKIPF